MHSLRLATAALLLASPSLAQSLTRTYQNHFSATDTGSGTVTASAYAGGAFALPTVVEGPEVEIVGVGFSVQGTQTLEADYVNTTSVPVTVYETSSLPNQSWILGDPNGCAIGTDPCFSGCESGGGLYVIPAHSDYTEVVYSSSLSDSAGSGPGAWTWPCILQFGSLYAAVSVEGTGEGTTEVRATATIEGTTEVTAELHLNTQVTSLCPGTANSTGFAAVLEYFGSIAAGANTAAVRVSQIPTGEPAFCMVTNAYDITPLGVGPLPSLCLRGARVAQEVKFTVPAGASGEAIFDISLAPFAVGDTFAIQVGHRDGSGPVNTSNLLVGTAQ